MKTFQVVAHELQMKLNRVAPPVDLDDFVGIAEAFELSWSVGSNFKGGYRATACERSPIRPMPVVVDSQSPTYSMALAVLEWLDRHPEELVGKERGNG